MEDVQRSPGKVTTTMVTFGHLHQPGGHEQVTKGHQRRDMLPGRLTYPVVYAHGRPSTRQSSQAPAHSTVTGLGRRPVRQPRKPTVWRGGGGGSVAPISNERRTESCPDDIENNTDDARAQLTTRLFV